MKTVKRQSLGSIVIAAVVALTASQGCSDDSDANPTPPDVTTGGTKGNGGSGNRAGSSSNEGGSGNTGQGGAAGGGTATEAGSGNAGGDGPIPQPECELPELGEDGCFNCPKNGEAEQWLNRCADSDCEPFDNAARLPLLNADGSLPDLPN